MAKRRKKSSRRRRGGRRMGEPGGMIQSALGVVAGAVIGRLVAKKVLPNIDERIKNAGVLVLGTLVMPRIVKGEWGKTLGAGMIASGGIGLVGTVLPGIGAMAEDSIDFPMTVGEVPDNISVIAGDSVMAGDDLSVISGDDEEDIY